MRPTYEQHAYFNPTNYEFNILQFLAPFWVNSQTGN